MVGGGRDDRRRSPALEEFRSRTPTAVASRVGIFQPVHHGVMGTATVGVAAATSPGLGSVLGLELGTATVFDTVTAMFAASAVLPAASRARADRVCAPLETPPA